MKCVDVACTVKDVFFLTEVSSWLFHSLPYVLLIEAEPLSKSSLLFAQVQVFKTMKYTFPGSYCVTFNWKIISYLFLKFIY